MYQGQCPWQMLRAHLYRYLALNHAFHLPSNLYPLFLISFQIPPVGFVLLLFLYFIVFEYPSLCSNHIIFLSCLSCSLEFSSLLYTGLQAVLFLYCNFQNFCPFDFSISKYIPISMTSYPISMETTVILQRLHKIQLSLQSS